MRENRPACFIFCAEREKRQYYMNFFLQNVHSTFDFSSKRKNTSIHYDTIQKQEVSIMNEELDYAEMLEIPVETVTVRRKEKKKRVKEPDLQEQLVEQINDRLEETPAEEEDGTYAESTPIQRIEAIKPRRAKTSRIVLIGEFVAVCVLCATIFLTNIFLADSAINTFVRGLFQGNAQTTDTRGYSDFKLSPVVNDYVDAEIAVSETGVLSFTAKCSVYAPCEGKVASVNGDAENGYTMEIKHSDSFSTIVSGLKNAYVAVGDGVKANIPVGFSDGEQEVRVMFYSEGTLLNCYTVNGENQISWS